MPAAVERVAPSAAFFAARCLRGAVRSRQGVAVKYLPVTVLAAALLLFVGVGFVASDPGPQAAAPEAAGYIQGHVQEAHVGYYEEHLARLALVEAHCR